MPTPPLNPAPCFNSGCGAYTKWLAGGAVELGVNVDPVGGLECVTDPRAASVTGANTMLRARISGSPACIPVAALPACDNNLRLSCSGELLSLRDRIEVIPVPQALVSTRPFLNTLAPIAYPSSVTYNYTNIDTCAKYVKFNCQYPTVDFETAAAGITSFSGYCEIISTVNDIHGLPSMQLRVADEPNWVSPGPGTQSPKRYAPFHMLILLAAGASVKFDVRLFTQGVVNARTPQSAFTASYNYIETWRV